LRFAAGFAAQHWYFMLRNIWRSIFSVAVQKKGG
jgi:hypothetical protein